MNAFIRATDKSDLKILGETNNQMKIQTPLKWHGGKFYLAPKIVALMPPHLHYVEPYFGGGAVLLSKNPEGISEVVNDIDGDLTNFWSVLRSPAAFEDFHRMAQATPFSEAIWNKCQETLAANSSQPAPPDVVWAWRFFTQCRQSLAGRMKSFAPISRTRTRRGMNEQAAAWLSAVEGLPALHTRLGRVVILNRDALDVIRSQDGPDTLFYLDPPYLHETRVTTADYAHEMTADQHRELLDVLSGVQGKFMLSGYRSESYDAAADRHGWVRHEFDLPNNASGSKTKQRKIECVWANGGK